ncbi:MAG: LapA family protein [Candidatus Levyibacteriota bacterium]
MRGPMLLLIVVTVVIGAFAALNWSAFSAPTALSFGFGAVQAPLGLVLLGMMASLVVVFLAFALYLETSVLLATRRHAKQLEAERQRAEQAEASRLADLRAYLEGELRNLAERGERGRAGIVAHIGQSEAALRAALEQTGNSLAAYLGELEDRLERAAAALPDRRPPPGS